MDETLKAEAKKAEGNIFKATEEILIRYPRDLKEMTGTLVLALSACKTLGEENQESKEKWIRASIRTELVIEELETHTRLLKNLLKCKASDVVIAGSSPIATEQPKKDMVH